MGNPPLRGQRAPCRSDRAPDECPASHPNRATDLPGHLHRGPDATTLASHDLYRHHATIQTPRHDRTRNPHQRTLTSWLSPSLGGGNPRGVQYSRRHSGYFLDGLRRPVACRISRRNRRLAPPVRSHHAEIHREAGSRCDPPRPGIYPCRGFAGCPRSHSGGCRVARAGPLSRHGQPLRLFRRTTSVSPGPAGCVDRSLRRPLGQDRRRLSPPCRSGNDRALPITGAVVSLLDGTHGSHTGLAYARARTAHGE